MSESFRMMMERYLGFATMHGRDMHKDPDAWGDTLREQHRAIVEYVESAEKALNWIAGCRACTPCRDRARTAFPAWNTTGVSIPVHAPDCGCLAHPPPACENPQDSTKGGTR